MLTTSDTSGASDKAATLTESVRSQGTPAICLYRSSRSAQICSPRPAIPFKLRIGITGSDSRSWSHVGIIRFCQGQLSKQCVFRRVRAAAGRQLRAHAQQEPGRCSMRLLRDSDEVSQ